MIETVPLRKVRVRGRKNLIEDLRLLAKGILDFRSLLDSRKLVLNPVKITVTDQYGVVKNIRYTHNLRTNAGGDLQAKQMGGDTSLGFTGTATATSATTLTDGGQAWTTNQWAGHIVFAGGVYGVVLSNTGTVLTVDKWYAPATPGGAAGTTPGNVTYVIGLGQAPAAWIAVSSDAVAPATADTALAAEITTNGLARALATWAHTAVAGGTTSTVGGTYTLTVTYTATGTVTNVQKSGILNASRLGTLMLENTFTPVSVNSTDNFTVAWTVTY